jgi:peptidoglycan-N-acetylglucosamine deacetylase
VPMTEQALIRRSSTTTPVVAFTFDACATRSQGYQFDRRVLEVLRREQVPAAVFVSGRWVEQHPEAMRELASDPLFEFGNHSWDHPHLPALTSAQVTEQLARTDAALARYGVRSIGFRPPFGAYDDRVVAAARAYGLPTVLWDVESGDPSPRTTADRMISEVTRRSRAGSILIFHINGRGLLTADVLPIIIANLRAKGLGFVKLSQLLPPPTPSIAARHAR